MLTKVIDILNYTIGEYMALWVILAVNMSAFFVIGYAIYNTFYIFIWNFLTPGQQWFELLGILFGLSICYILWVAADDFEKKLNRAFSRLKSEIAEKNDIIKKKDEQIENLLELLVNKEYRTVPSKKVI